MPALEAFWRRVARCHPQPPPARAARHGARPLVARPLAAFVMLDLLTGVFWPYEPAPWAPNPLEAVPAESVDFGRLARAPIKLFITAPGDTEGARWAGMRVHYASMDLDIRLGEV